MDGSGSGAADCAPGSIVWVRRRNGSWWPGKILGPEELADSHLTSPRAGTPVKLLGREDASVDWYNLEKSKRVKAFRCGEFDDYIGKVESSQAMPSKKREKYASREDAILHALELEKQQLRKQGNFDIASKLTEGKLSVALEKNSVVVSPGGNKIGSGQPELAHVTKRHAPFPKDEVVSGSYLQNLKDGDENYQEDGLLEGLPRMRGLQDFGLKIAPPKRKHPSSFAMNGLGKPKMNDSHAIPVDTFGMRNTSYIDGGEDMGVTFRAKRSRCMYLPEEYNSFMDDKENPQSKIQISPSTSGEGNHYPSLIRRHASRLSEGVEGASFDYYVSESDSDSSETEQNTNEETSSLSDFSAIGMRKLQEEHGSMSSEDPDGPAFAMGTSRLLPHDRASASQAVSKWQLKGKRNIRNLTRRPLDASDGKDLIGSSHQMHSVDREIGFGQKASNWSSHFHMNNDFNNSPDEVDVTEEALETHSLGDPNYVSTPRIAARGHNFQRYRTIDWEHRNLEGARYVPAFGGQHHFSGRRRPLLFDVDLKVQVSYPKERVPIVAMTSKLNGNSIIGHSIKIEAIEDGSSDHLLLSNPENGDEATDGNRMALPPAWRTARRTANFRVPRPNPTSAFDGDEDVEDLQYLDHERKSFKNVGVSQKGFLVRRTLPHMASQQSNRKNSRKLSKRVSLSSRQKIRTLSSIAVEQNLSSKSVIHNRLNRGMDGLIEPGSSRTTTVACIPVKLVFSRLLEKINRPPSRAVTNLSRFHGDCRERLTKDICTS